jgi:putative ABC transport system ATP-binding protein
MQPAAPPLVVHATCLSRSFVAGDTLIYAVKDVNIRMSKGEFVALVGPSGCGKSTLLNMIGLVERPSSGTLLLMGEELSKASETALTEVRRATLGYVFQAFNLLSTFTVEENVMLPCVMLGQSHESARVRARELLANLGLAHRATAMPSTLSGGEMQRVAIARAVAHKPKLLLADEPTGNLDSAAGEAVLELLQAIHSEGTPILMATHSEVAMKRATRVVRMCDGAIVHGHIDGNA